MVAAILPNIPIVRFIKNVKIVSWNSESIILDHVVLTYKLYRFQT